ncbi:MAG: MFS transporter [Candidatus Brocadia sp.]|nr:MFS transporter [Candidatus Brocadia sp.]
MVSLANGSTRHREASRLILLLGVVSLFADATYESARSILGPYLAVLGTNGTTVGMIAGVGELVGYGLRLGSGYVSDRTGRYWGLSLAGFSLNMIAVPLLALTGRWEWVAALIVLERTGKAIRNPPRDAILSNAAQVVGRGWGFGLQEALGQIGAVVGPLAISVALHLHADYRTCLGALAVPAVLTLVFLALGARFYPEPQVMEPAAVAAADLPLPRSFWFFLVAAALIAAGSLDFPLVAYHIRRHDVFSETWIPALYAVVMGSQALSALGFGLLFDRMGPHALLGVCVLTVPIAPLAFWGHPIGLLAAMILWGLGMGAQKAMFKATIARLTPSGRRGFAYGCFDVGYGLFWFLGSALMGFCYEKSLSALISVSIGSQFLAIPMLLIAVRRDTGGACPEVSNT